MVPKIDAPTVAEHRAHVHERLIDAAEQLMRTGEPLTATAVSTAAGIARNSIYRYVDCVDDLRGLVVARYLPAWLAEVERALAQAASPADQVVAWVRVNLAQASASGHGWLMEASRATPSEPVEQAHLDMRNTVSHAWLQLLNGDVARAMIAGSLTMGVLEGGFRQLNQGAPAELVIELAGRAADGLVRSLS